jgi:hypothetical protein
MALFLRKVVYISVSVARVCSAEFGWTTRRRERLRLNMILFSDKPSTAYLVAFLDVAVTTDYTAMSIMESTQHALSHLHLPT